MKAKFNKKVATGIMTALIAVSFIPSVAGACRGRGGQGKGGCAMKGDKQCGQPRSALGVWKNPQMVQDLALTPEQVGKLKKADFAAREKKLALKAEMSSLRLKLDKAFAADTVDDTAVRALAEQIAAVKGKMSVQRVETRLIIEKLLTPEQAAKLETLRRSKGQGKNGMNKPCMMNGGQGQGKGMGRK